MPAYVRSGGTWKESNRVYTRYAGVWKRVHGAYSWTTKDGQTKWWPVWEYGDQRLPPTSFRGTAATHSTATLEWTPVSDVMTTGYRIQLHGIQWYPALSEPPLPLGQASFTWGGLSQDSTYTWTIHAEDEARSIGPASNAVTLRTGHPTLIKTNPSWPGADFANIWPYATNSYYDDAGRWGDGWPAGRVEQGIGPGTKFGSRNRGCVSYDNAWGHFMNACASWGTSPPQNGGIVAIDTAEMMQIYRYRYQTAGGTVKCMAAPGSINFAGTRIRHPGLAGDHGETWFNSPTPNAWRFGPFGFANGNALVTWMRTWMGLGNPFGYGYNGMIILDNVDHSPNTIDLDGINYVNLAGGYGNGDPGCPWLVRVRTRFSYVHSNYLAPAWG